MIIKTPSLNFNFSYFEPYICYKTMKIHYIKYHKYYTNKLNNLFYKFPYLKKYSLTELIMNLNNLPNNIKEELRKNLGGYINHSFFWKNLGFNNTIHNSLMNCICNSFGNFNNFKYIFEIKSNNFIGSGWIWLIYNNDILSIYITKNNDNPIMGFNICNTFGYPILVLDLWEHSYYLKYNNNKLMYIKSFWNIIDWNFVSKRYLKLKFNINKYFLI